MNQPSHHLPLLLLLALSTSGCFWERPESSYSSFADAKLKGAIDKGWIPAWLPASTTDIRELHDIDTNESMLAFNLDPKQGWPLPDHCQSVTYGETSPPRFSRRWWPSAQQLEESYDFYRCKADVPFSETFTWVGQHKSGERGIHWRAHAR